MIDVGSFTMLFLSIFNAVTSLITWTQREKTGFEYPRETIAWICCIILILANAGILH